LILTARHYCDWRGLIISRRTACATPDSLAACPGKDRDDAKAYPPSGSAMQGLPWRTNGIVAIKPQIG